MLDYENQIADLYGDNKPWKPRELSSLISGWVVPEDIKIEDGNLFWRWGDFGDLITPDQRTMRREVLDKFLRIADAPDEIILSYARQWGVLGLCEHGVPFGHELYPKENVEGFKYGGRIGICVPKPVRQYNLEALERWRYYSRQMQAIVALAAALRKPESNNIKIPKSADPHGFRVEKSDNRDGSARVIVHVPSYLPGKPEDWTILFQDYSSFITGVSDSVWMGQSLISLAIDQWLHQADVKPYFLWLGDKSRFGLRSNAFAHGLFSILTIQLMLLINGSPDYAICYTCHKSFFLRKGQNTSRKSYCIDCYLKASQREASKKYYRAEREDPTREKRKRLTPKQAQAIQRALKKTRPGLVKELARKYGVSEWAIYKIHEGKTHSKDLS